MSEVTENAPKIPLPDTLVIQKNGVDLQIPWRAKKSGKATSALPAGTPIPFIDKKSLGFSDLVKAFGEEFVARCAFTRLNSALTDWYQDVCEKKGIFIESEFVKRVQEGKVVRQSMEELNEALDEVFSKLEALTAEVDANGGYETAEGQAANAGRVASMMALINEQTRLQALKNANKRKRKTEDDDDE